MTSDVEDIFSRFYLSVEDYNLAKLAEDIVDEMLTGYMRQVLSDSYVRRLYSTLALDTDVGELTYTLRESIDDEFDKEFTEELIAKGMLVRWLSPKYNSVLNTSQFFSNSDLKFYSQSNHMSELKNMYDKALVDFRKFIRDRGYASDLINSE